MKLVAYAAGPPHGEKIRGAGQGKLIKTRARENADDEERGNAGDNA